MVFDRKKIFFGRPAPPGYIPGAGRGATGFTTRSDIGPAREATDISDERNPHLRARFKEPEPEQPEEDPEDLNDANYDEFSGYSGNLFKNMPYEKDDEEADLIYKAIDMKMDERRKDRREKLLNEQLKKYRKERPKIQQRFVDLKRDLANVTQDEWFNIPEVGDKRNKKMRNSRAEKFTPIPDSIISSNLNISQYDTNIPTDIDSNKKSGFMTSIPGISSSIAGGISSTLLDGKLDLSKIGEAKKSLVGVKLDLISDSVSGQTVVDPKGYLTDLQSITPNFSGDIGDIKKARLLLQSVITSNSKHGPGWIAAARLEEVTGHVDKARNIINQGTRSCPKNDDVWLESIRLHPPDLARSIISIALEHLPNSVRLWIKAAEIESENITAQRKVYRKALECIPNSVRLWKAAVGLEEPADALILLTRAVECCPTSVDLWLALAKLETYENARKILNKARQNIPTDRSIWVNAAKLEEVNQNIPMVEKIINRSMHSLSSNGIEISIDQWFRDADECEKTSYLVTAEVIIKNVLLFLENPKDNKHKYISQAEEFTANGSFHCARVIYEYKIDKFPDKKGLWLQSAYFEQKYGTNENLNKLLSKATRACPKSAILWLMAAKSMWVTGNVPEARSILCQAFVANPNNEEIWLAAIKLESENKEYEKARRLLKKARNNAPTNRVFTKSARLEYFLDQNVEAMNILNDAILRYKNSHKFYIMKGQIEIEINHKDLALQTFREGLKNCQNCEKLWCLYANLSAELDGMVKARSIYDQARGYCPKSKEIWLSSFKLEMSKGNKEFAASLLTKALQECPKSGELWFEAIFMEPRVSRKTKSVDALRHCDHDEYVLLAISLLFWIEGKIEKARSWFEKTYKTNNKNGDVWIYYYKFELKYGTIDQQQKVLEQFLLSEPRFGILWCKYTKSKAYWGKIKNDILLMAIENLPNIESI